MLFYSLNSEFELFEGDCIKELTGITRRFDMIFADPPYFLSGAGKTVKGRSIVPVYKGDWDTVRSDDEKDEFNYKWLSACREVLKDDGTIWICGTHHNIFFMLSVVRKAGLRYGRKKT